MNAFCGLDFGTSNTTLGIANNNTLRMVSLENSKPTIRSAIFCDTEIKQWVFGQEGVDRYLEGFPGRLMMALKSVLGSSLMDEKTIIFNEYIPYTEVLYRFIKHVKLLAESESKEELSYVVMGRPVYFHDHDKEKDKIAENTLKKIALQLGFKEVTFEYEPIAAAIAYETTVQKEQIALIVDMGGGTSDFTVIRVYPGKKPVNRLNDVLASGGIHIAGTDFDQQLSLKTIMPLLGMGSLMRGSSSDISVPSMLYHDLTTWHTLKNNYSEAHISHIRSIQSMAYDKQALERLIRVLRHRAGHHILNVIEKAKQQLSENSRVTMDLSFIEAGLTMDVSQEIFNSVIQDQVQQIIKTIRDTVLKAEVDPGKINAIFYTGGSSKIPMIREQINALFPNANVIQGDAFGSVGLGLTIEAQRKYGA